ncbi:MAG: hydrogenase (NiFe) small subunit HydA [Firmicutes bacterium]|nr:hydrogenase (NiFe) small subunit HydA [Bacillota bacterium]
MDGKDSLWGLFQQRGLSRRSFLKVCMTITGILGLSPAMLPKVVSAAEQNPLPVVVWLHGHECTGCDESFIRSQSPLASDVLLNMISLEYSDTLSAAAGEPFEHHLEEVMKRYEGKYLLAVEGGVSTGNEGTFCMVGGKPFVAALKEAARGAAAVLEIGSCAAWGGVQAAKPNPTNTVAVHTVVSGKPIIKIPGCPPIPEVLTGVVMHYAMFGQLPPVDSQGRPKQFYGNRIHDTCYRRPFFNSGMFAEQFDDAGSKAGWCLYKLGCRGPETYNSCGNLRWWNGLSYPIQSGHGCIGCSSNGFWDNDHFYDRMPGIPVAKTITNADTIGLVVGGAAVAGVAAHGALSVLQKSKRRSGEHEEVGGPKA